VRRAAVSLSSTVHSASIPRRAKHAFGKVFCCREWLKLSVRHIAMMLNHALKLCLFSLTRLKHEDRARDQETKTLAHTSGNAGQPVIIRRCPRADPTGCAREYSCVSCLDRPARSHINHATRLESEGGADSWDRPRLKHIDQARDKIGAEAFPQCAHS
jgi:hypothetical protein